MLEQLASILGAIMVLGAFAALQRGWLKATDRVYNLLNLVGAWLLCWVAVVDRRVGFIVLEFLWGALAIPPLFRRRRVPTTD